MISTQTKQLEPLTSALLKELASQQGPCTTFLIRGTTGAGENSSRIAALRGMLRSTPSSLLGPDLLHPVEDFVAQFEDEAGGPGVALFRSPDYFAAVTVSGLQANAVLSGAHFALAPLAVAVLAPPEFYILALHRKNLHLLHYLNGSCETTPLPADVPADLETALAFDVPDHLLEGRSSASRGGGATHTIQFGTSSDKEAAGEYLQQYFRIVDRGLKPLVGKLPLLLAGVHEDVTAYRRIATNSCILESGIGGNMDFLSPSEISDLATEAALTHYQQCGELVLRSHREMRHRERALTDTTAILEAARAGRIHQLCAADNFDPEGPPTDDPVNAAIAETLRHHGEVFMLAPKNMPEGQALAAILRYQTPMSFSAISVCPVCGAKNRIPANRLADTGRCGACKSLLPPVAEPLNVDQAAFDEIIGAAQVPVLVDFWADWCEPCRMAAPEIHQVAREVAGQALVLKVDTEAEPRLAARFQVQSIPYFVVFRNGQPAMQRAGVTARIEMRRWLAP